ncbi:MAG: hypothetical protein MZW92_62190 [Comamonadaceae bacterium]|nr:hypothetical protein [Comamonadaceae bacterium]
MSHIPHDLPPPIHPDGRRRRRVAGHRPPPRPRRAGLSRPERHPDQGRHRRRRHGPGPPRLPRARSCGPSATSTAATSPRPWRSPAPASPAIADFREVLARPDIDIVHIATPPHWHALIVDRRGRGRQGRLVREAHDPDDRRGPGRRRGGPPHTAAIFRVNTWFRFTDRFYGFGTDVQPIKKVVAERAPGLAASRRPSARTTGFDWKFYWSGLHRPAARAGAARARLRLLAGPGALQALPPAPRPRHLPRLLGLRRRRPRRHGHALPRPGPVPPRQGRHEPGRDRGRLPAAAPRRLRQLAARSRLTYADGCVIVLDGENRDTAAPFLEGPKGKLYRGFESDIPQPAGEDRRPARSGAAGHGLRRVRAGRGASSPSTSRTATAPARSSTWPRSPSSSAGRCGSTRRPRPSPATRRPTASAEPAHAGPLAPLETTVPGDQPMKTHRHRARIAARGTRSPVCPDPVLCAVALGLSGRRPSRPGPADLKARVSSILERFPAETAAATRRALRRDSSALGPAGPGRDLRPRPAAGRGERRQGPVRRERPGRPCHPVGSGSRAARASSRPCSPPVATSRDKDVAAFFMTQVQLAGRAEAVKPLAEISPDEALAGPAAAGPPDDRRAARPPRPFSKPSTRRPGAPRSPSSTRSARLRSREAVKKLLSSLTERPTKDCAAPPAPPWPISATRPRTPSWRRSASTASHRRKGRGRRRSISSSPAGSRKPGRTTEALARGRGRSSPRHGGPAKARSPPKPCRSSSRSSGTSACPTCSGPSTAPTADVPRRRPGYGRQARRRTDDGPMDRKGGGLGAGSPGRRSSACSAGAATPAAAAVHPREPPRRRPGRPAGGHPRGGPARRRARPRRTSFALCGRPPTRTRRRPLETACSAMPGRRSRPGSAPAASTRRPHPRQGRPRSRSSARRGPASRSSASSRWPPTPSPRPGRPPSAPWPSWPAKRTLPRLVAMLDEADGRPTTSCSLQNAVAAAAPRPPMPRDAAAPPWSSSLKNAPRARKAGILRVLPEGRRREGPAAAVERVRERGLPGPDRRGRSPSPNGRTTRRRPSSSASRRRPDAKHRLHGRPRLCRGSSAGPIWRGRARSRSSRACWPSRSTTPTRSRRHRRSRPSASPKSLRLLAAAASDNPVLGEATPRPASSIWRREQAPQERWLLGPRGVLGRSGALEASRRRDPTEKARIGELICGPPARRAASCRSSTAATLDGWKGLVADPPRPGQDDARGAGRAPRPRPTSGCGPTGRSSTAPSSSTARARASAPSTTTATSSCSSTGRSRRAATAASTCAARPRSRSGTRPPMARWARAASTTTRRTRASRSEKADRPVGEWNTFRIIMIGERVTRLPQRQARRRQRRRWRTTGSGSKPIYPAGADRAPGPRQSALLPEHLHPRDPARRRPSPPADARPRRPRGSRRSSTAATSTGWTGDTSGYACRGRQDRHPIPSAASGEPLHGEGVRRLRPALRVQADARPPTTAWASARRSRATPPTPAWRSRSSRTASPVYWGLRPYQYHGSIYGVVPARRGFLRAGRRMERRGGHGQGPARHGRRQRDDHRRRRHRRGNRPPGRSTATTIPD